MCVYVRLKDEHAALDSPVSGPIFEEYRGKMVDLKLKMRETEVFKRFTDEGAEN